MATDRPLVYVAGPIGGTTDFCERFQQGRLEVVQLGYQPVVPLDNGYGDLGPNTEPSNWCAYLRRDIRTLLECNGIYLLRGWENSRGARLEKLIADGLDMFCLFQSEGERDGKSRSRD